MYSIYFVQLFIYLSLTIGQYLKDMHLLVRLPLFEMNFVLYFYL